jgi:hypothetical protein
MIVLLSFQRMQNSIRELKPFGCHLALNGTVVLVLCYRHHVQAMLGIARVFFVLVIHGSLSWLAPSNVATEQG